MDSTNTESYSTKIRVENSHVGIFATKLDRIINQVTTDYRASKNTINNDSRIYAYVIRARDAHSVLLCSDDVVESLYIGS